MKKYLLLFLAIVLTSSVLFANNKSLIPGYIITLDKDSVKGFFISDNWRINPMNVDFSSTIQNGDTLNYNIDNILGFGTSEYRFEAKEVTLNNGPTKVNSLGYFPSEDTIRVKAFLLVLVDGPAKLYSLRDQRGKDHYLIETKDYPLKELLHLPFKKITKTSTGIIKYVVIPNKKYYGQLKLALNGCPSLNDNDLTIDLVETKLVKLIKKYNTCILGDNNNIYSEKIEKWVLRPYITGGLCLGNSEFNSSEALKTYDFNSSSGISFNAGLIYIIPKYKQKFSIYTDLGYNTYSYRETSNSKGIDYSYSQFSVNYGINYNFSPKKNNFFIKLGLSSLFLLKSDFSELTMYYPHKFQMGLNLGAGVNLGDFSIQYLYQNSSGLTSSLLIYNNIHTHYFIIGLTFGNKG